jgi:hypothetical protein
VGSSLLAALASDDVEGLLHHLFATGEPNCNQTLRVVCVGGDMFGASRAESRELSILAVSAQFGAVRCGKFLLANWAKVGTPEMETAFRSGHVEMMKLVWNVFPNANPLQLTLAAVKSWNVTGLRWLLDHKIGKVSLSGFVALLG